MAGLVVGNCRAFQNDVVFLNVYSFFLFFSFFWNPSFWRCLCLDKSKVHCDATLVFPLLVAQTFAKEEGRIQKREGGEGANVDLVG